MLPYTKPPIDDKKPAKKPVKKSKKKNMNSSKIDDLFYDPYSYIPESNPNEYSPNAKNTTFSKDDYMNDLTEEQLEMLFDTSVNENHKDQLELEKDVDEFFHQKLLDSETDGDIENMRKICQDSAQSFLPFQA